MFKILVQGVEIQCDTVEAAVELARKLATSSPHSDGKAVAADMGNSRWTSSRFQNFTSELKDKQRQLLMLVLDNPDGLTDQSLRQTMGVENNNGFGPIMAAISKRAKKLGIQMTEILTTEKVVMAGGEKMLEFKAAPAFQKIAKASGGIK